MGQDQSSSKETIKYNDNHRTAQLIGRWEMDSKNLTQLDFYQGGTGRETCETDLASVEILFEWKVQDGGKEIYLFNKKMPVGFQGVPPKNMHNQQVSIDWFTNEHDKRQDQKVLTLYLTINGAQKIFHKQVHFQGEYKPPEVPVIPTAPAAPAAPMVPTEKKTIDILVPQVSTYNLDPSLFPNLGPKYPVKTSLVLDQTRR